MFTLLEHHITYMTKFLRKRASSKVTYHWKSDTLVATYGGDRAE
jgi:hypothetical protein